MVLPENRPSSTYLDLRGFLFPDQDLRFWVLDQTSKDSDLRAVQELIRHGRLREARESLMGLEEGTGGTQSYWYTVAYLESLSVNRPAARGALHQVLELSGGESRASLATWKLLRDLGEEPPPEEASRVHGVVFEVRSGAAKGYNSIAGYADGQIRWLSEPGPCLIGENWTDSEKAAARRLVEAGQEALSKGRFRKGKGELPKRATACLYLLTPGGTFRARTSLGKLEKGKHPLHELSTCALAVHRLGFWLTGMATQGLSPRQQAEALMAAVLRSDTTRVKNFLGFGASATSEVRGITVLAAATEQRNAEIVRLLVARGADVDAKVTIGERLQEAPILILAAAGGACDVAEELLGAGADPDATDTKGTTALMFAAYLGHADIVRALIEKGAWLEATDASGYTALMFGAKEGRAECVTALLKAGSDVNAQDNDGNRPLAFAAQHGFLDVVEGLLAAGADANSRSKHGLTAADLARRRGHREVAEVIEIAGASDQGR